MEHMELAGFWGYCKDFLLMENIMHFSLFPTSDLLFSPFKTFFFFGESICGSSQNLNVYGFYSGTYCKETPENKS